MASGATLSEGAVGAAREGVGREGPTLLEVQEMKQPGAWDHPDSGPARRGDPKELSTELK